MFRKNMSVMMVVFIIMLGMIGCSKKTDIDKLVGSWCLQDEDWAITFFEPDDEERTSGDMEIVKRGEPTTGIYEWHESGKRIILMARDNWGAIVELSYDYEIIDDSTIQLVLTDSDDKPLVLIRSE